MVWAVLECFMPSRQSRGFLHIGLALHFSCPDAADHDVDMDISRMVVSVRVGADDSRMTGKVLFAEVQAEGLCLFHRQPFSAASRGSKLMIYW